MPGGSTALEPSASKSDRQDENPEIQDQPQAWRLARARQDAETANAVDLGTPVLLCWDTEQHPKSMHF